MLSVEISGVVPTVVVNRSHWYSQFFLIVHRAVCVGGQGGLGALFESALFGVETRLSCGFLYLHSLPFGDEVSGLKVAPSRPSMRKLE